MKAAIINRYGAPDVIEVVSDHPKPTINDQEVLVRVHACSVNPIDWKMRRGELKFLIPKRFPRILGADVSGVVEEVGNSVSNFEPGDEVYGLVDVYRGGGYSEYVPVKGVSLCHKPANLSFEEAAAVPVAAMTALQCLRDKGNIQQGCRVLIIGASGGVGTFGIQIAKMYGADVTAVASTSKQEICLSLGADTFVDYTQTDLTNIEGKFDIIFDAASVGSFCRLRHLLNASGNYVDTVPSLKGAMLTLLTKVFPGPNYRFMMLKPESKDLEQLKILIESQKVKPVLSEVLPLEQVAEAHRKLEEYNTTGKTVLLVPAIPAGA